LKSLFFSPGCRFMFTIRGCQYYTKFNPLGIIFRIWNKNMQVKYGLQIFHTCKIGKGLFMVHYGTIVINNRSIIGNNCNIHQGVTILQLAIGYGLEQMLLWLVGLQLVMMYLLHH
jgi:serine O-acetyltransferase